MRKPQNGDREFVLVERGEGVRRCISLFSYSLFSGRLLLSGCIKFCLSSRRYYVDHRMSLGPRGASLGVWITFFPVFFSHSLLVMPRPRVWRPKASALPSIIPAKLNNFSPPQHS